MKDLLLGFWTLASWQTLYRDGSQKPYRDEPIGGFLHYGEDDLMAVSIFTRDRPELLSSYGGSYSCEGEAVVHAALEGYSPYGLSDKKVRLLRFGPGGQALHMATDWIGEGDRAFRYELLWNKRELAVGRSLN